MSRLVIPNEAVSESCMFSICCNSFARFLYQDRYPLRYSPRERRFFLEFDHAGGQVLLVYHCWVCGSETRKPSGNLLVRTISGDQWLEIEALMSSVSSVGCLQAALKCPNRTLYDSTNHAFTTFNLEPGVCLAASDRDGVVYAALTRDVESAYIFR